jgi:hypothetical protein
VQIVYRNRVEISPSKLPAIVLLDGSERFFLTGAHRGRNGRGEPNGSGPSIMIREPQIFFVMKPKDLKDAEAYGPELSAWRAKIIKAIYTDMELAVILTTNGDIEFRGSETDFHSGGTNEGQLQLNFAFYFPFNPMQL